MWTGWLLNAASKEADVEREFLSFTQQFLVGIKSFWNYLKENSGFLLWDLLMAVAILFMAKGVLYLVSRATKALMEKEKYHRTETQGKRVDTLMTLARSVARYVIYFIALLMILNQFGFNKSGSLAVAFAGIGSFAVGFGAQNLVKDVVTGLFMMFENQFAVGDYIKTDEAEGTVEATAMRVTYLRSLQGDQIIIPNGSISRVVNYTRGGSVAAITISTAYEADTRKVMEVISRAVDEYARQNQELIEDMPVVRGITNLGESSVDIGVACKAKPMKQWEVERGMRLAVKELFDREGVEFPYPHLITVPFSPPARRETGSGGKMRESIPDWANGDDNHEDDR